MVDEEYLVPVRCVRYSSRTERLRASVGRFPNHCRKSRIAFPYIARVTELLNPEMSCSPTAASVHWWERSSIAADYISDYKSQRKDESRDCIGGLAHEK